MSRKNQEAENRYVRRKVWGDDSTESPESEDMGHTILGDVNHPTPIIVAGGQSGGNELLKAAAIALLGAAIPGAGVAGYFLNQALKPTETQTESAAGQQDFSVGLGKIEDYLND